MKEMVIGVIGGSGMYELENLKNVEEVTVETPFGPPSDALIKGNLNGKQLVFLSRHGRGHRLLPSEINYRANIFAFKKLNASFLISVSAVGSMKEQIVPGHFVFPNQFIDLTKSRVSTFFGEGIVGHVPFAEPVCPVLAKILADSAADLGITVHRQGTYVCMEGPQFSTRGESLLYRQWGVDVIGMTNMPEAKLAREAEISYATMALATDYDCWYEGHESVTIEAVLAVMGKNIANAKKTLVAAIENIDAKTPRPFEHALKNTIVTAKDKIPKKRIDMLKPIFGKYLA